MVAINTWYRLYELEYILNQSDTTTIIMMDKFLNNDFIEMIGQLCPELGRSEPGKLNSEKYPLLKRVICLSDKKYDGMFSFKEVTGLGEEVSTDHLKEIQNSVQANDVANLLYTSGTTAFPKGVQLSHINIGRNGFNIGNRQNFTEKDRLWLSVPLFFSFACVNGTLTTITHGGCIVLQESFDPEEALQLIDKEKCTVYYGMPNMSLMILDHPDLKKYNTKSLRTGMTIGAPDHIKRVIDELGPKDINNGFGLTETAAEEEGEICIKGYNVTRGYYKKPEETAKAMDSDGWFHSGDLGILDDKGYLAFKGRIKDILKSGGINVSTLEVEEFLHRHPKVREAHVVGVPDPIKDEVGLAFIDLKEGETSTEKEILSFCKGNIASFKIPRYVIFGKDFPRTATGKVQKFKLKEKGITELGL